MDSSEIVRSDSGKIRGYRQDGVLIFKGIQYANPAVGPLRFAAPQPVSPWRDVLEAMEYSPRAMQPQSALFQSALPQSEDRCLTLNIWTPDTGGRAHPVLFWIHGGAMLTGTGAEVDGRKLAARGHVTVVSINYRLGVLGFLYVPGKTANVGLLDQIEALKWVRQNIEHFGGDPANVTVFAESAGGISITALMKA